MTVWPPFEETSRGFSFSILAMCAGTVQAWQDPQHWQLNSILVRPSRLGLCLSLWLIHLAVCLQHLGGLFFFLNKSFEVLHSGGWPERESRFLCFNSLFLSTFRFSQVYCTLYRIAFPGTTPQESHISSRDEVWWEVWRWCYEAEAKGLSRVKLHFLEYWCIARFCPYRLLNVWSTHCVQPRQFRHKLGMD